MREIYLQIVFLISSAFVWRLSHHTGNPAPASQTAAQTPSRVYGAALTTRKRTIAILRQQLCSLCSLGREQFQGQNYRTWCGQHHQTDNEAAAGCPWYAGTFRLRALIWLPGDGEPFHLSSKPKRNYPTPHFEMVKLWKRALKELLMLVPPPSPEATTMLGVTTVAEGKDDGTVTSFQVDSCGII